MTSFHPSPDSVPPIQRTHPFQKQRKSKKRNPEREEKLTEEIRNEAPIDGIPEVRRRDSSENRVQERIVAAVNGRVPEDEESRDSKEREERAVSEEANFLPSCSRREMKGKGKDSETNGARDAPWTEILTKPTQRTNTID